MLLYKYREDNTYTENIFLKKEVWLSNAKGLNDPFECSIQEIAKDWIDERIKESKGGHISGFVHSALMAIKLKQEFYGLTLKETKQYLKKFQARDFEKKYTSSREFIYRKTNRLTSNPANTYLNFDNQLNEVGIFSLSETPLNQLMWSHYGGNSKGIAIGFEPIEGSKLNDKTHCLKVNYSDELPQHNKSGFLTELDFMMVGENIQRISFNDPTLQLAISTKPTCWSYEKEWRYVEPRSGLYKFPGKLCEVIFGLNCNKETKRKYCKIITDNFDEIINFYEIIRVPNTNQIDKIRITPNYE